MKKLRAFAEDLIITATTFVFLWLLSFIPMQFKFLDPIGKALSDFELQDIVFSQLREEQPADTSIVLVNIGTMSRGELATLLQVIAAGHPAVTGVDVFFYRHKDSLTDAALSSALAATHNLILVSKLSGYNKADGSYAGDTNSLPIFSSTAGTGYANLPSDDNASFRTIRYFRPYVIRAGERVPSFAAAIVQRYDPASEGELRSRELPIEMINYRGNTDKFITIEGSEAASGNVPLTLFSGKIVLLGFMGNSLGTKTLEDIFFTPVNERYAGKAFPDMYGIVIHANIISMLLHRSYITPVPEWLSALFAVIICVFVIRLHRYLRKHFPKYTSEIFKAAVLVFSIINLAVTLLAFSWLQIKISLTLALLLVVLLPGRIDFYDHFVQRRLKARKPEE